MNFYNFEDMFKENRFDIASLPSFHIVAATSEVLWLLLLPMCFLLLITNTVHLVWPKGAGVWVIVPNIQNV